MPYRCSESCGATRARSLASQKNTMSSLFSTFDLRDVTLRNRVVLSRRNTRERSDRA
jgi:hypothetical protein